MKITLIIPVVLFHSLISDGDVFGLTFQPIQKSQNRLQHRRRPSSNNFSASLFAEADGNDGNTVNRNGVDDGTTQVEEPVVKALGASPPASSSDLEDTETVTSEEKTVSSQVFMITREMKRTMVEELGYKRTEVDSIRLELVGNIIENCIRCPLGGMPVDWVDLDRKSVSESVGDKSNMMKKLESESKYPLKFPLLAISLILFGKGFSDALITLIKVNIDFPGATFTALFQGIPVLAIDAICVAVGAGLGLWTFKTMK